MKTIATLFTGIILLILTVLPGEALATKHVINVQNYTFSPANINNVTVGDTMRWVWVSGSHTTTSTTIPSGAATWNSPITSTVTSYEYKVTKAGTYNYKCTPHTGMGMVGSFVATASVPTLTLFPQNRNVGYIAGSTSFSVTSNAIWTTSTDRDWCTATPSGSGNGTIVAPYLENPTSATRIATISIEVEGLEPSQVTVTQDGSTLSVGSDPSASFRIFPNPAKDKVVIKMDNHPGEKVSLYIFDAIGNQVYQSKTIEDEAVTLNLASLPRGSYFVRWISGSDVHVSKLLLID